MNGAQVLYVYDGGAVVHESLLSDLIALWIPVGLDACRAVIDWLGSPSHVTYFVSFRCVI